MNKRFIHVKLLRSWENRVVIVPIHVQLLRSYQNVLLFISRS